MDGRTRGNTDFADLATHGVCDGDRICATNAIISATRSGFPLDVKAIIYRPAKSAMTSGRAGTRNWVLEFEPRSPLFIEPLMGWTSSTDPLRQVRLTFPSKEAAIAYAERQGIGFSVRTPHEPRPSIRRYADNFRASPMPSPERAGQNPSKSVLPETSDSQSSAAPSAPIARAGNIFTIPEVPTNRIGESAPHGRKCAYRTELHVPLAA